MILSHAIKGYFLDKEFQFSDETLYGYRLRLNALLDFLGDVDLEQITKTHVREFLSHARKERDLSDRSVYDYWVTCSSFWTWAAPELSIPHVVREIPKPTFTKKTVDYFTKEEITTLLKNINYTREYRHSSGHNIRNKRPTAVRDRAIITVLLDCGLRISELCGLKVREFNEQRGTLFIAHGKGDKERMVPLGKRSRQALWRYLGTRNKPQPDDALFTGRSGRHMDRGTVGKMLRIVADHSGITTSVNPHKFRHTFAITFLRNGGNVLELQSILGHEDVSTVKVYVRLANLDLENAQRKSSPVDNWQL